jgi:hypothetical protein
VRKVKKVVRKDLVIWPSARMTVWRDNVPKNEPLAILEWTVNHWHCHNWDVEWLRRTSLREDMESFIGYAVMVEHTQTLKALSCTRIQAGEEDYALLRLSAKEAASAAGSI